MSDSQRSNTPAKRLNVRAKTRWPYAFSAAIAVLSVIAWYWIRGHRQASAETADRGSQVLAMTPHVEVVQPKKGGVPRMTVQPGSMQAFEAVDLCAMVSGYLKSQSVDIGSHVKKGQVLAEIGVPREENAAVEASALIEQARAHAKQTEARVRSMEATKNTATAKVAQARADVERTSARHHFADSQHTRVVNLNKRNVVQQAVVEEQKNELDAASAAETVANLAVQSAEAEVKAVTAKIEEAHADVAEAQAALAVAEARLAKARVDIDYSRIVAPFDGVVTFRGFFPGSFIRSATEGGDQPLLKVARTERMRVVVQIPDRDVVFATPGDPAVVIIDALNDQKFQGEVSRVASSEDALTRTMRVEIDLANPNGVLRPGMYGQVNIRLESHPERLTVPVSSLMDRSGKEKGSVRVVRDGKVQKLSLILGLDDGTSVEVVSGLSADDQVVLHSSTPLDDGTSVIAEMTRSNERD